MDCQNYLCCERLPFCSWLHTQHNPILSIPAYLQSHYLPSGTIDVSGHLSDGSFHDHRHDMLCVYTGLGPLGRASGMGFVDHRHHHIDRVCFVFAIFAVRHAASQEVFFNPELQADREFYSMSSDDDTHLSSMTAVWLMPVITCVVNSGSGAIVANALIDTERSFATIIASYILWGIGLPLSMMVFVIYFQRLTIHKLPPKETIVSVFLPMGPLGSGAFS